jgi:predicted site-specific integrase-resolvase
MMTDQELCAMLRIHPATLRRHLRQGTPKKQHRNSGDIRQMRYVLIGGKRRWKRSSVMAFIDGE